MDAVTIVVSIGGAALSGGGVTAIVNAIAKRRSAPSEITARLNAAAMAQVDQLQEETASARTEARQARQAARDAADEVDKARRQVRALTDEVDELTGRLHRLLGWIHEPTMSIDRLRLLVPAQPNANGTTP